EELAIFVKSRRKHLGRSQTELGELVGIKQKTVSAFETHPELSKIKTLFDLLSALQLEIQLNPKELSQATENTEW
ncbi:MAG: helix-turn-helix domain-containing protein, partial [Oligoflexales bacterium]|nr:helix-turn-helix domain-containing protein [Oligoflexales bacterium]